MLPALLLLIFMVMEGGRALTVWMVLTNATHQAVRYGAAGSEDLTSAGAVNPTLVSDISNALTAEVSAMVKMTPTVIVTPQCLLADSQGTLNPTSCATSGAVLASITVTSTCKVDMLTPLIQAITPSVTITSQAVMRAE